MLPGLLLEVDRGENLFEIGVALGDGNPRKSKFLDLGSELAAEPGHTLDFFLFNVV